MLVSVIFFGHWNQKDENIPIYNKEEDYEKTSVVIAA